MSETDKWGEIVSVYYSRKKKEDEMVPARQFEVNECKSITTEMEKIMAL